METTETKAVGSSPTEVQSGEFGSASERNQAAADDWSGLGDLLALATERLTAPVEGMHHAIADRWFGLAGPKAALPRTAYHGFTAGVYRSVRMTGSALGTAVGLGAAAVGSRKGLRPLWRLSPGSGIQAVVNALWGDELEHRRSPLRIELSLRGAHGEPIGTDPVAFGEAFPDPTPRLVVLLHGLGRTERCWLEQTAKGGTPVGFSEMLTAGAFTPLLVRYNTGRHVSDNGDALAALLEEVMQSWPMPVEDVSLVGHSMGGLVARSAIHAGRAAGHRWASTARHVVTLGSPHLGAPLEKGVNLISWGMGFAPESIPLGRFLDQRSAGIKDLRFGAIREDDWEGADPDALLDDGVDDVPLPEGVRQHFVAGIITAEPTHPIGVLVGDLIIRVGSGTGRGRRRRIDAADVRVFAGRGHVDLLHDPVVHDQVREWLSTKAD